MDHAIALGRKATLRSPVELLKSSLQIDKPG